MGIKVASYSLSSLSLDPFLRMDYDYLKITEELNTVLPLGHVKLELWVEEQISLMLPSIHKVTPVCVRAPRTAAKPCAKKTVRGASFR